MWEDPPVVFYFKVCASLTLSEAQNIPLHAIRLQHPDVSLHKKVTGLAVEVWEINLTSVEKHWFGRIGPNQWNQVAVPHVSEMKQGPWRGRGRRRGPHVCVAYIPVRPIYQEPLSQAVNTTGEVQRATWRAEGSGRGKVGGECQKARNSLQRPC